MEGPGGEEGAMQVPTLKEGIDMAQEDLRSKAVAIEQMRQELEAPMGVLGTLFEEAMARPERTEGTATGSTAALLPEDGQEAKEEKVRQKASLASSPLEVRQKATLASSPLDDKRFPIHKLTELLQ